jgi:hypothetical protein
MKLYYHSFRLQKSGNSWSEYEDAYFPVTPEQELSGDGTRIAIADGSSEGMLSSDWAKLLVNLFCERNDEMGEFNRLLETAYSSWVTWKKDEYLPLRDRTNRPILWFEEHGLEQGSFSTLLGMVFHESSDGSFGYWESLSIGDSCLFQIRKKEIIKAFPMTQSAQFNNQPLLLCSNISNNDDIATAVRRDHGKYYSDDRFIIMTDALACWFLEQHENGGEPWLPIYDLATEDAIMSFEDWITKLREEKSLKNDDVTLIRIDVM